MEREEEIRKATQTLFEAYRQLVGPHKASDLGINEFLTLRDRAEETVGFQYEMHAPPERRSAVSAPVRMPVQTEETPPELQRQYPECRNEVEVSSGEEEKKTTPQREGKEEKPVYRFPTEEEAPAESGSLDKERAAIAILNAID